MTIPLSTTTIKILRIAPDSDRDYWDAEPSPTAFAEGVRAHIGSPGGSETRRDGSQEVETHRLNCDPVALDHNDSVVDENTGEIYQVLWVDQREGFSLDHTVAGLLRTRGHVV